MIGWYVLSFLVGYIIASIVNVCRSSVFESGIVMWSFCPSKFSACPSYPFVHVAQYIVPSFPCPDSSFTIFPAPSLKSICNTTPLGSSGGCVA